LSPVPISTDTPPASLLQSGAMKSLLPQTTVPVSPFPVFQRHSLQQPPEWLQPEAQPPAAAMINQPFPRCAFSGYHRHTVRQRLSHHHAEILTECGKNEEIRFAVQLFFGCTRHWSDKIEVSFKTSPLDSRLHLCQVVPFIWPCHHHPPPFGAHPLPGCHQIHQTFYRMYAGKKHPRLHIIYLNARGPHDGTFANHPRPHKRIRTYPSLVPDMDLGFLQGKIGLFVVVRPGTKVGTMRNGHPPADGDFPQIVKQGIFTDCGSIPDFKIPGHINNDAVVSMHFLADFCTKKT